MKVIDSHCHIHDSEFYGDDREQVYERAVQSDVDIICIGTNQQSSLEALQFAASHDRAWATIGVHPHDSKDGWGEIASLLNADISKIVGIGEIGLDYCYDNSPRQTQVAALEAQLQLAVDNNLPVSFHVREAYDDFWSIFDNFPGLRGVLHSYTDDSDNLERALSRGLYIGVNGISTFARDKQAVFNMIPLDKMLLETDAPFLTPVPFRGKVNEPAYVRNIAEYHGSQRDISTDEIIKQTTINAQTLFGFTKTDRAKNIT
ncbi:MAG: TatD family hydrolase [bacterium]|nr:TatD family hydrolase [bacterium]MDN5835611.1 TatD family hydrolase [bacterium]